MKSRIRGGKPPGELSAEQRRAMRAEIKRQVAEQMRLAEMDQEAAILWMLHEVFGFGKKRLEKAWRLMYEETKKLREWYVLDPDDDGWISKRKLKEIGVDLEQWYKEAGLYDK